MDESREARQPQPAAERWLGTYEFAKAKGISDRCAHTLRALTPVPVHEVWADQVALNVMADPRWFLDDDLAAERSGWFSPLYHPRWGPRGGFLVRSS